MSKFSYDVCISIAEIVQLTNQNVLAIQFNVGRYGQVKKMITFEQQTDGLVAIKKVEEWLSMPLPYEEYSNLIKHNDLDNVLPFENYTCRGDALGNAVYLEVAEYYPETQILRLSCGS